MTFTQLRYYLAVCKSGSVTKAARSLYVSQPSVTTAIKGLENELGVNLLSRRDNIMVPTSAGEMLLRFAEQMLKEVVDFNQEITDFSSNIKRIHVGMTPLCRYIFPDLFEDFFARYPDVEINFYSLLTPALENYIQHGHIDLAFSCFPVNNAPHSQTLLQIESAVFVSKRSKLAKKDFIDADTDLKNIRAAVYCEEPGKIISPYNIFLNKQRNVVFRTNQIGEIKKFIIEENGYSLMIESCFKNEDQLIRIPLKQRQQPLRVSVFWNREKLPDYMENFITFAKNSLEKEGDIEPVG